MADTETDFDELDQLAESFLTRLRQGETPTLGEYIERYPHLGDRIREVFPSLAALERFGAIVAPPDPIRHDGVAPRRLGEYSIIREIGRGAMGVVYEAVQESLGRRVALKVLTRFGPSSIERFQREARIAARLHHTNIVPVYGVGADHEVTFYAMQFIAGQGLNLILKEVRRRRGGTTAEALADSTEASGPSADLATSSRNEYFGRVARLALQAAEALAYAHSQGVLHRDLKPSNLLLDAQGTLWVADFGLAQAQGENDLTGTGMIVGTLRYMAPERISGRCDERGDVYALGATLYEMLTLLPAFDAADHVQLMEQVSKSKPRGPRQIDPGIPRDLETIVLKCMASEPHRRYAAAADLAEDLRQFLADRPIKARPPGPLERVGKWARRNPGWAALLVVSLVALALVSGYSYQLRRALNDANTNLQEANRQNIRANDNLDDLQKAVTEFTTSVRTDPTLRTKDLFDTRRKLLRSAAGFYEKMLAQTEDRPDLLKQKAGIHFQLGYLLAEMREDEAAHTQLLLCLETQNRLLGQDPDNVDLIADHCACLNNLGTAEEKLGNPKKTREYLREAMELNRRGLELDSKHKKLRHYSAIHEIVSTTVDIAEKRWNDAEVRLIRAEKTLAGLREESPKALRYACDHARTLSRLAQVRENTNRSAEALKLFEQAMAIRTELDGNDALDYSEAYMLSRVPDQFAELHMRQNRLTAAEPLFVAAWEGYTRLMTKFPGVGTTMLDLVRMAGYLARVHRETARLESSLEWANRAVATIETHQIDRQTSTFAVRVTRFGYEQRAATLKALHRPGEAAVDTQTALLADSDFVSYARVGLTRCQALVTAERNVEAMAAYRVLISELRERAKREPAKCDLRQLVAPLAQLATLLCKASQSAEAKPMIEEFVALRERFAGENPKTGGEQMALLIAYRDAGLCWAFADRFAEALALYEKAAGLERRMDGFPAERDATRNWLQMNAENRAYALYKLDRLTEAAEQRALASRLSKDIQSGYENTIVRIELLILAKNLDEALRVERELAAVKDLQGPNIGFAALSIARPLTKLPPSDQRRALAERSLHYLTIAVNSGKVDLSKIRDDPNFAVVRELPGFAKLGPRP